MQFIKLLINISKEESKEYCEENDIKYENEVNSSDISKYIDLMQKKHPETKFCLLKSSHDLKIKKIIQFKNIENFNEEKNNKRRTL